MKSIIIAFACVLAGSLAIAQTSSTTTETVIKKKPVTTTETVVTEPVVTRETVVTKPVTTTVVTEPVVKTRETTTTTTYTDGTVASYEPGSRIIVRKQGVTDPISYTIGKTVRFVNKAGREIKSAIKPGARVHVYYTGTGETQVVERVVVDEEE
jgi:hypothetical protein